MPDILPERPPGPVSLLVRTTGLETSLPLSGVVRGLFCLIGNSKYISSNSNIQQAHDKISWRHYLFPFWNITIFFTFDIQEDIQLYTNTEKPG